LITRADLVARGVPVTTIESWLRGERLHAVFHEVYAVGHPSLTREERWLAAVLACGEGAVLSHQSAALLWAVVQAEAEDVDVSVPRTRAGIEGIAIHRRRHAPRATTHRGIPTTTLAQTLVDLAATFTPNHLERAYTEAQLHPLLDENELSRLLEQPTRGVKSLRQLAAEGDGPGVPRNVMERRFLRIVREAGLPRPEMNVPWGRWNIDALWREPKVAVELDSRTFHQRRQDFARDRQKDRDLQLAGYLALRFTATEVMRRPAVVTAGCCRACASGPARAWSAGSRTR